MNKLARLLYAFVGVTLTVAVLAIEGVIGYYFAVHGVWPVAGLCGFLMLVVLAGVLKGVTAGRR